MLFCIHCRREIDGRRKMHEKRSYRVLCKSPHVSWLTQMEQSWLTAAMCDPMPGHTDSMLVLAPPVSLARSNVWRYFSCDALGDLSSSGPGDLLCSVPGNLLRLRRICSFHKPRTRGGANHRFKRSSNEIQLPYWSIAVVPTPCQAPKAKDGSVTSQQGHA